MWRNDIEMWENTTDCNMDKLFVLLSTCFNTQLTCINLLYYSCKSGGAKLDEDEGKEIDSEDESIVVPDEDDDLDKSLRLGQDK